MNREGVEKEQRIRKNVWGGKWKMKERERMKNEEICAWYDRKLRKKNNTKWINEMSKNSSINCKWKKQNT